MPKKSRKQIILDTAEDLMSNFLYYDRKEDEQLTRGEICDALNAGEVTEDEILAVFRRHLAAEARGEHGR